MQQLEAVSVSQFGKRLAQIGVSPADARRAQLLLSKEAYTLSVEYSHEERRLVNRLYSLVECWLLDKCPVCQGKFIPPAIKEMECWHCGGSGRWSKSN